MAAEAEAGVAGPATSTMTAQPHQMQLGASLIHHRVRTRPHPGPLVCSHLSSYSQQTDKQLLSRPSLTSWPGCSRMPGEAQADRRSQAPSSRPQSRPTSTGSQPPGAATTSSRLPYPPVIFGMPARQPPPYPTQGYCAPVLPQAPYPPGRPAPPKAQASKPSGTTDLLPDGEETFSDFCQPQFAVPTNSAGEEQLRRAGLDPQLLQQLADPASAL